jgi:hypothetical protein
MLKVNNTPTERTAYEGLAHNEHQGTRSVNYAPAGCQ